MFRLAVPAVVIGLLWVLSWGAPLGVLVADDFDFLRHAQLHPIPNLLDGGGSESFWRPLAHQFYFALLRDVLPRVPWIVPLLHGLALGIACWAVLGIVKGLAGPSPWGLAVAAAFLTPAARELLSWASHSVDVGLVAFSCLALYAATLGLFWPTMVALLAALFCKETAVVTAVVLPIASMGSGSGLRQRSRWIAGPIALVVAWAIVYAWVAGHVPLAPSRAVHGPRGWSDWPVALVWSLRGTARAAIGLPMIMAGRRELVWWAVLLACAGAGVMATCSRTIRKRIGLNTPLLVLGAIWFVLGAASSALAYPVWAPYRALYSAIGLWCLLCGAIGAIDGRLLALLALIELWSLVGAQRPDATIPIVPIEEGAWLDEAQLWRLQFLTRDVEGALRQKFPTLAPYSVVGRHYFPQRALYAFGDSRALQVWYRDTTLRWVSFDVVQTLPPGRLTTIVEFQPKRRDQIALVTPLAMSSRLQGLGSVAKGDWSAAVQSFDTADRLLEDPRAKVFLASNAYMRGYALAHLGQLQAAEAEARSALAMGVVDENARLILALVLATAGRESEALVEVDSLLSASPNDRDALQLRSELLRR